MLTREEILRCKDLGLSSVEIPEWGGTVFVRQMTALERLDFARENQDDDEAGARLVARLVIDEGGQPIFTPEDAPSLMTKNANVITRIVSAILEFNALGRNAVEDAQKNSGPSPSSDSPSS